PRTSHTATLLLNGQVLVAGGIDNTNSCLASAEIYPGTTTGSLATARCDGHTATLLPSGKVLVAGGENASVALASAEIYDPVNHSWSPTGPLAVAHRDHTATLLSSGKVLIASGYTSGNAQTTVAELYDSASNSWSSAGNLGTARAHHTATRLQSGKVFIAGSGTSTEIYDPASNTWSGAASASTDHFFGTATLLTSGRVLLVGGGAYTAVAELYDPISNSWSFATSLPAPRAGHTATTLPSGQILIAGGSGGSGYLAGVVYDAASNTWTNAASALVPRAHHTATMLLSGQVLIAGGNDNGGVFSSAVRYTYDLGIADSRRPLIGSINSPLFVTQPLELTGSGFAGDSEGSSGGTNSSATNSPLVQLRSIETEQIAWISPAANSSRSDTSYTSAPLSGLLPGAYALSVLVNAVPSNAQIIQLSSDTIFRDGFNGNGL
ncbi:MAG: kelch repeat-containing protein, partial [Dokdonella sp.]